MLLLFLFLLCLLLLFQLLFLLFPFHTLGYFTISATICKQILNTFSGLWLILLTCSPFQTHSIMLAWLICIQWIGRFQKCRDMTSLSHLCAWVCSNIAMEVGDFAVCMFEKLFEQFSIVCHKKKYDKRSLYASIFS